MAGASAHAIRQPAVAGMFYPADPDQCRALARSYTTVSGTQPPTRRWLGGVVPHAGWICSGAIAGQTLAAIAQARPKVDLVVVFGAIHTPLPIRVAALDSYASWNLPGQACQVQQELRSRIAEKSELFAVDDRFHRREHAVEVELPLIQSVWPQAAILPIEVPPDEQAVDIGRQTARAVAEAARETVFLASSDLTHYGPNYGFMPAGTGPAAMQWAKQNDLPLIEQILRLQEAAIVPQVRARANACGAGAIAAMLAACRELGASDAKLLRHATSYETLAGVAPQPPDNAVGYAAIVVG